MWRFLKVVTIEFLCDPAIVPVGIYSEEVKAGFQAYLYTDVHGNIIHNTQKVETTQVSISGGMGKQDVVYPYNELLFSRKKEGNLDICYNR